MIHLGRPSDWVAYAAALWASVFAAFHITWAVGWYPLLDAERARIAFATPWKWGLALHLPRRDETAGLVSEMAVAYFKAHFPHGFWPIQNHGEPAVLFCFIYLFLWGNGAGPISLDHLIASRRTALRG